MRPADVACGEYNSLLLDLNLVRRRQRPTRSADPRLFDTDGLLGDAMFGDDNSRPGRRADRGDRGFLRPPGQDRRRHHVLRRHRPVAHLRPTASIPNRPGRAQAALNDRLIALAKCSAAARADPSRRSSAVTERPTCLDGFWYAGRIRYTRQMFRVLARRSSRRSTPMPIVPGKCWCSISTTRCGAASSARRGLGGIELGEGPAVGEAYLALPGTREGGWRNEASLLAVASKNDLANAKRPFERPRR